MGKLQQDRAKRHFLLALGGVLAVFILAGGAFLMAHEPPAPTQAVEKPLPAERFAGHAPAQAQAR